MERADIGLIGVGTMGSALALNIADKGYDLAIWNLKMLSVDALIESAGNLALRLHKCDNIANLVNALPTPRVIILLVPAGQAVDDSIDGLLPHLSQGDTIIDGGNSDFRDTIERTNRLEKLGFSYLGVGVSGGEEGARWGPSLMAGGTRGSYESVEPILTSIAAKYGDDPCVAYLGSDGAGHFVRLYTMESNTLICR